jgi:hypothetical protein
VLKEGDVKSLDRRIFWHGGKNNQKKQDKRGSNNAHNLPESGRGTLRQQQVSASSQERQQMVRQKSKVYIK